MANLKVNTEAIITTAISLKVINKQINDAFPSLQAAISRLDSSWDGMAATNAISKFNEIKADFYEARYNVIDNYINFLLRQVGEGYTQTEDVNKSLSDSFK